MEQKTLEELLDSYPETVKNMIIRVLSGDEIVRIGAQHGLRVDDQALLYTMVRSILVGEKTGGEAIQEFQLFAHISGDVLHRLIGDVNTQILRPVQELMQAEVEVAQVVPAIQRDVFGMEDGDGEDSAEQETTRLERLMNDNPDFSGELTEEKTIDTTTPILPTMGRGAESTSQTTGTSPFLNRPSTTVNLNKSIVKGDLKSISRESIGSESKNPLPVDKYREAVE